MTRVNIGESYLYFLIKKKMSLEMLFLHPKIKVIEGVGNKFLIKFVSVKRQ